MGQHVSSHSGIRVMNDVECAEVALDSSSVCCRPLSTLLLRKVMRYVPRREGKTCTNQKVHRQHLRLCVIEILPQARGTCSWQCELSTPIVQIGAWILMLTGLHYSCAGSGQTFERHELMTSWQRYQEYLVTVARVFSGGFLSVAQW